MTENNILIRFPAALLLLFTGLKLTKVIAWSWLWVLSPLWGVVMMVGTIVLSEHIYLSFIEKKMNKRR